MEVLDKGKAASVTTIVTTKDKATGQVLFENHQTVFVRGAGGFGGKRNGKGEKLLACARPRTHYESDSTDRGAATASNAIPKRKADAVVEDQTLPSQAALYRLVIFLSSPCTFVYKNS